MLSDILRGVWSPDRSDRVIADVLDLWSNVFLLPLSLCARPNSTGSRTHHVLFSGCCLE